LEVFALVKAGSRDHAAVIIEDLQERRLALLAFECSLSGFDRTATALFRVETVGGLPRNAPFQ